MREAVIVSGARTPVGRARKGALRGVRADDLAATAIREALARAPAVDPRQVGDLFLGCSIPEREQGMNLARIAALRAGLPVECAAVTVNRFCASGLETIAMASEAVRSGRVQIAVAGGVESMSRVDIVRRAHANPELAVSWPEVYLEMGLTAERLASRYGIRREDADRVTLESHRRAVSAIRAGRFRSECVPVDVEDRVPASTGSVEVRRRRFEVDECPREDASIEALARLRPVFARRGTVTAAGSSPLSDGAAAVVVMEEGLARSLGLEARARLRAYEVVGVEPEWMGLGPARVVPALMRRCSLRLDDIDLIELNEAFAVQVLAVRRELDLPADRVNVNGGALALGHPLGCTGTKLVLTALHELERRNDRRALVAMCVGGGMGAAGLLERA